MPQPIVNPKDKVNEYNILLYDWDPTAASSKEILQRAGNLFDVQLRLMPDHPASGVLGTRPKLYQVGLVCGYVHTYQHAIAFTIHIERGCVLVYLYESSRDQRLVPSLKDVSSQ